MMKMLTLSSFVLFHFEMNSVENYDENFNLRQSKKDVLFTFIGKMCLI